MVEAKFTIGGMVDKPDIIGAVFGQTEGLLGDQLDLRELQKSGKIGRIEIELSPTGGKSFGKLFLPASLDRIETCILAAAIESVDRVGPYEAQFLVDKVEDTRSEKRRKILIRAKDLVKLLLNTEIPDSKELSEMVQSEVRTSEITNYGQEKLPAGPEVGKMQEVVIVEGRADVLNLLKNDVANAIALGGAAAVPKSIIDLCREKEITVFLDGDRGGDLILRNLVNVADIDYVARAPDGKEVEDLTRKEIIKSMRSRVPLDQYMSSGRSRQYGEERPQRYEQRNEQRQQPRESFNDRPQQNRPEPNFQARSNNYNRPGPVEVREEKPEPLRGIKDMRVADGEELADIQKIEPEAVAKAPTVDAPVLGSIVFTQLASGLDELAGTLRSRLYDNAGNVVREMPIRELLPSVQNTSGVYAIVLDGVITQRLVELALQKGIKAVYGLRANPMPKKHSDIILYTKEQQTEQSVAL